MSKILYATGSFGKARVFRCIDCPFDVMSQEAVIVQHCKDTGHGIRIPVDLEADAPPPVMITVGYLCWNTREASVEGWKVLQTEKKRLELSGCVVELLALDNGSTDGTLESLLACSLDSDGEHVWYSPTNIGSSRSRNMFIDYVIEHKSKYLLLLDGDIEIVPGSISQMIQYLECHPDVGCIGAYSQGQTPSREHADTVSMVISDCSVRDKIQCAWTQYGLFRVAMFSDGIRFDITGPFGAPGWGYEDDDFYWQMKEKGYPCRYFTGMTYLHRNLHSSWKSIEEGGTDVQANFEDRKAYLIAKWRARGVDPAILNIIEGQQFPRA